MPALNIWGAQPGGGGVGVPPGGGPGGVGVGGPGGGGPGGGWPQPPVTHLFINTATINVTTAHINLRGVRGAGGAGGLMGGGVGMPSIPGVPGMGGGFLGTMVGMGVSALGLTSLLWISGMIVRDIISAPQWMGRLWQSALSMAEPYIRTAVPAYALARAGGFQGSDFLRMLFPGGNKTPPWMSLLGVTPQAALESINQLGVVPRTAEAAQRAAQVNAMFGLAPGFSGLQPGTVEKVGGQGLALGQTTMGGLQNYLQAFGNVMDDAIARGMDRARILSSIGDTLEVIARSGAPVMGTAGFLDFFSRLMGLGTPAARTGALQQQMATGLAGTMQNPFGTPMTSMMSMAVAGRFNNFRTEADIRAFMHLGPGTRPEGMPQTMWNDWVRRITAASRANPAIASALAMQLGAGNAGAQEEIRRASRGLAGNLPSYLQPYAAGAFTGLGFAGGMATMQEPMLPPAARGGPTGTSVAGMGQAIGIAQGNVPVPTQFDPSQDYTGILRRAGVPENLIPMFVGSGQRNAVSPIVLAAIAQQESGFNVGAVNVNQGKMIPDLNTGMMVPGGPSSTDYGLMQINSANLQALGLTAQTAFDPARNIEAGAEFLRQRGLGRYNPGNPNYSADIAQRVAGIMAPNIPSDILRYQAQAAQSAITGGAAAMATFVPAVSAVSDAFTSIISALQTGVAALSRLTSAASAPINAPNVGTAPAQ